LNDLRRHHALDALSILPPLPVATKIDGEIDSKIDSKREKTAALAA
jgi:hypothetical protein